MNVIQVKDSALYPNEGGHYTVQAGGTREIHWAYMVLGRVDGEALVIEGSGPSEMAAIEHLMRQVKFLRDWTDIACHGSFWMSMEAEQERRLNELRGAMGMAPLPTKKDDDNGLS